jgi:hypothetical protein
MATETSSHILCECVAINEFRFCRLGNIIMEPSDYDDVPLCKILYFLEVRDYWRNKADGNAQ